MFRRTANKWLVSVVTLVLTAVFVSVKLTNVELYKELNAEDGPVENSQALAYLISTVISLVIAYYRLVDGRKFVAFGFFLFAMIWLFIFAEEISWGQRILNMKSPAFFVAHNYQGEVTIHNLTILKPGFVYYYIVFSALGTFGWVAFGGSTVKQCALVPPASLTAYFAIPLLTAILVATNMPLGRAIGFPTEAILTQEPCELLLALGVLFWMVLGLIKTKRAEPGAQRI
jgi:hypothetical protein